MARKCIKKLILMMIELIILVIIEVHSLNRTPFSPIHPSSLPTSLHHFPFHYSYNHHCLETTLEICEDIQDLPELEWCITHHLFNCLFKNPIHLKASLEELEAIMEKCAHYCLYGENKHEGIRLAPCFLDCWEKYTKKRN